MSAAPSAGRAWGSRELWLVGGASAAALVYDPLAPAADVKRVALLLVGAVALLAGLLRPQRPRGLPQAVLGWLALVAWLAVAAARSGPLGLRALGTWVGATALLLAAVQGPRHQSRAVARWVAQLVGGTAALVALAEYITGARGLQVHGGQGNPNWLGLLLALTLPLTLEQALGSRRRQRRLALLALLALQAAGLYLSHSRVAWAAAVAGWLMLPGWPAVLRSGRPALAAAALALLVLVAPRSLDAGRSAVARAAPDKVEAAGDTPLPVAFAGRLWIWQTSLGAAARALPLGVGLGGFADAYLDAQGRRLAELAPRTAARRFLNATTAHNDWLEVAVEGGPVALLLLAATWGWAWAGLRRGGRGRPWRAGSAVLTAWAVCALGDSPLEQPAALIVLVLVLAASPRARSQGSCRKRDAVPDRPAARSLYLAAWATSHLADAGSDGAHRVGLVPSDSAAVPPDSPRLQRTVERAAVGMRCLALLGAALLLAPALGTWLGARLSSRARAAAPGERAALLAHAARVDPRSGEIALERGLDALLAGDAAAALPELWRSRSLLANVGTDVAIGNAELGRGRPDAAVAAYQRALRRHPGSFRAHANLAMAYGQLGALALARQHLATARALQPGHPKLAEMAQRLDEQALPPPAAP